MHKILLQSTRLLWYYNIRLGEFHRTRALYTATFYVYIYIIKIHTEERPVGWHHTSSLPGKLFFRKRSQRVCANNSRTQLALSTKRWRTLQRLYPKNYPCAVKGQRHNAATLLPFSLPLPQRRPRSLSKGSLN